MFKFRILTVMALLLAGQMVPGMPTASAAPQLLATLIVNTGADGNNRDSVLTLREALLIARGNLLTCLTDAEAAQIFDAGIYEETPAVCPTAGQRKSIGDALSGSADTIIFANSVSVVTPTSQLPGLGCTDGIRSDFSSNRRVTIQGASAGAGAHGLVLDCALSGANNLVSYLTVRNFAGNGIQAGGIQSSTFHGLEIHTNAGHGIELAAANARNPRGNRIGFDTSSTNRNIIRNNGGDGVRITGDFAIDTTAMNNLIQNSYIGTDAGGTTDQGNSGNGVKLINAWNNTISATLISGNSNDGVNVQGADSAGNGIFTSKIGTNAAGTAKLGNAAAGVAVLGGARTTQVGLAGRGNVIAGNGNGVFIADANTRLNSVKGNTIGTNFSSAAGLGNSVHGVTLYAGAFLNFIGGSRAAGDGNTISGNGQIGIDIANSDTYANYIYGNLIGTNQGGTAALGNGQGLRLFGGTHNNVIGDGGAMGGLSQYGNLISGNLNNGIGLYNSGTIENEINANFIGTNLAGTGVISNAQDGIVIQEAASSNVITANLISGNGGHGVRIQHAGSEGNQLYGNTIGLNVTRTGRLGNKLDGVSVQSGAVYNTIGAEGRGNTIAGNTRGVAIGGNGSDSNVVMDNAIGSSPSGAAGLGNSGDGVLVYGGAKYTLVGLLLDSGGNLISGNGGNGISIRDPGTHNTLVYGNLIGTNPAGNGALSNGANGVQISNSAMSSTIGSGSTFRNIVSGNANYGVLISDLGTQHNVIKASTIGASKDGNSAVANSAGGVAIINGAQSSTITGSIVAGNGGHGVMLDGADSTNNMIGWYNKIGLGAGDVALGNAGDGVRIQNSASNN